MPYVYAQAKESSAHGYPMLRTLFFEFPDDPTSWSIDDEYMFGSNLLVAPLMEEGNDRKVYLPPGDWIDYQTGKVYHGARWQQITAGQIPIILLVRDHSVIPHATVAQHTSDIDWKNIELRVFSTDKGPVSGIFATPDEAVQSLKLTSGPSGYAVQADPLQGKVKWQVTRRRCIKGQD